MERTTDWMQQWPLQISYTFLSVFFIIWSTKMYGQNISKRLLTFLWTLVKGYLIEIATEKFASVKFIKSRITSSLDTLISDSWIVDEDTSAELVQLYTEQFSVFKDSCGHLAGYSIIVQSAVRVSETWKERKQSWKCLMNISWQAFA